ncbi:hypothetical protein A2926_01895 [Candidatus Giovannonibacteria bacterium RIFCSPLOWO2_01_FULL_44_40]|uniref:Glycosyltransferase RgtA/B/C/D-like domain-containing protein n=1 Tax=Candidatus Giovannonibacteria bacterium RIFCSPHIGHO2_01_FULL_45_23 TaxID=1798325 RepID=A0A1F5VGJ1_9BACT|nr:MAG: hypothetical protein A2834_03265 [Candidatus Giovannonibacteria bacterium RIFCSPHIGHO2_01_FULL_45_23]OGF76909.1 MAG: hypothetical protein A3C77_04755 [Candidatus Giovannonibacteria bacterium RIFCSPHIGHO2_02_FULL_45_13]OGF80280.1 MAG: hypothetical protein A2926_01895 [Candidatus Giovannonibacteria bacterium RIFCSPLOWO2_01_FULL_44_40]
MIALWGLGITFLFVVVFTFVYFKFFRENKFAKSLFVFTFLAIFVVAILKLTIFYFFPYGYVSDRLPFYAVPSPKALGIWWMLGALGIFFLFLKFREKIEKLNAFKFLLTLYLIFIAFSISVAAIREGFYSVYEPFTRTRWEYTGDMLLVTSIPEFLRDYVALQPKLTVHASVHPPGYTLILYFFHQYLGAGFAGLAVLIIMLGGFVIFPLYYFLKNFATEDNVRRGLQIFIFVPSFVMMSATSMEAAFLFFSWLAIAILYEGWRRGAFLSFLGGVAAALALFLNYLFALLAPLFLILFFMLYKRGIVTRIIPTFFGFLMFFAALYLWTGYSIIENFFVAHGRLYHNVGSNFESAMLYLAYFVMNISAFAVYLGLPNIKALIRGTTDLLRENNFIGSSGAIIVTLIIFLGLFQGEVERLWLFLTPLFILPLIRATENFDKTQFASLLSLLFFQIILTQTLFYTYW